jgi:hypothetical protein
VVIVSLVIDGFMLGISMVLFCSEYQQLLLHCIGIVFKASRRQGVQGGRSDA